MPTAIAALTEAFSRNMILNAFRSSVWLSVMTRGWEPDAQDNRTVHIPNLTVPAAAIDNPGRTGDGSVAKPPTFASPSTTLTDLIMDQIVRSAIELEKLDALENAMKDGEYERRVSEQLGQMMALNIDANFGTAITGANFAAAQKITVGDAGNVYIPRGNPLGYGTGQSDATKQAASDELFMNSILLGLLNLTRANAIGRNFTVGPGEVSPVFWVGPPELTARFVQFLTKNSASGFSRDVLASSVQDSAGILSNMQFEGRWQNVDIMSTNLYRRSDWFWQLAGVHGSC